MNKKQIIEEIYQMKMKEARYTLKSANAMKKYYNLHLKMSPKEALIEELCISRVEYENAKEQWDFCKGITQTKEENKQ